MTEAMDTVFNLFLLIFIYLNIWSVGTFGEREIIQEKKISRSDPEYMISSWNWTSSDKRNTVDGEVQFVKDINSFVVSSSTVNSLHQAMNRFIILLKNFNYTQT